MSPFSWASWESPGSLLDWLHGAILGFMLETLPVSFLSFMNSNRTQCWGSKVHDKGKLGSLQLPRDRNPKLALLHPSSDGFLVCHCPVWSSQALEDAFLFERRAKLKYFHSAEAVLKQQNQKRYWNPGKRTENQLSQPQVPIASIYSCVASAFCCWGTIPSKLWIFSDKKLYVERLCRNLCCCGYCEDLCGLEKHLSNWVWAFLRLTSALSSMHYGISQAIPIIQLLLGKQKEGYACVLERKSVFDSHFHIRNMVAVVWCLHQILLDGLCMKELMHETRRVCWARRASCQT